MQYAGLVTFNVVMSIEEVVELRAPLIETKSVTDSVPSLIPLQVEGETFAARGD